MLKLGVKQTVKIKKAFSEQKDRRSSQHLGNGIELGGQFGIGVLLSVPPAIPFINGSVRNVHKLVAEHIQSDTPFPSHRVNRERAKERVPTS